MKSDALSIDENNPALHHAPSAQVALARRLKRNTASKLIADLVGRALQLALAYQAQITLGAATYGHFTYALAIGFLLAQLADLGVQLIVAREMASDEARAARIAGAGLALKIALAVLVSGLLIAVSLARAPAVQAATFVLGLAMLFNSFVEFFGYLFRGLQRVEYEAGLALLMRSSTAVLGLAALSSGLGLMGLAVVYLVGSSATVVLGAIWLNKRFFKISLAVDFADVWKLLRQALPLGGAIALSVAYTRTAVFLLDALRGAEAVGAYGVAQKLIEPLSIIPAALMAAVFPAFTQAVTREPAAFRSGKESEQVGWLRAGSLKVLALAGTILAAAGALGGPWLIVQLYRGQYAQAVTALQVLALALLPTFLNYALTHFLIALGWQRLNLFFNAIVFVLNFALCLALIPSFGPAGAALAVAISECALFAMCQRAVARAGMYH